MAHGPHRVAELGSALAVVAGVVREDRARRGAARADRGRRGARAGRGGRLLDDAAEAQPGRLGDRRRLRAAARGRGRAHGGARPGARARARRVAGGVGGAVGRARLRRRSGGGDAAETLEGLEVDPARMRANLDADRRRRDERARTFLLARKVGLERRRRSFARPRARRGGRSLRDALAGELSPEELDDALDPATYLGSAGELVDRALAVYRGHGG